MGESYYSDDDYLPSSPKLVPFHPDINPHSNLEPFNVDVPRFSDEQSETAVAIVSRYLKAREDFIDI